MKKNQSKKFIFSLVLFLVFMLSTIIAMLKGDDFDTIQRIIIYTAILITFIIFVLDSILNK